MKKFLIITLFLLIGLPTLAKGLWINDLRNLFLSNSAIIYGINIRTFAAQDTNKNGIIDENEESGNFLNAIGRLDEVQAMGVNTIHVLPIMKIGKKHAFGTAGSLYAASSFNQLNPQLKSNRSMLTLEEQAIKFIDEAHKRRIRVIIDLPACGSYDLYESNPELFLKDKNGQSVTPKDWKDVRILNGGSETNTNINVYNLYKDFVDYVISLGADGIRADVAPLKPAIFWKKLIDYSHTIDPQFLWLAETAQNWEAIEPDITFTPYNRLLEAGFDGIYSNLKDMPDWTKASEFEQHIKFILSLKTKYQPPKSVIGSFATHDEINPIKINGRKYSEMIMWLNSTLPLNAYYLDGFPTGDTYIYFYANKKANKTFTDDDNYFVHLNQMDIFNFSRQPGGNDEELRKEFMYANKFKSTVSKIITNGKYTELKTSNNEVFAYAMSYQKTCYMVFGNMNFMKSNKATIKIPQLKISTMVIPIRIKSIPIATNGTFNLDLEPGEIQVIIINDFEL